MADPIDLVTVAAKGDRRRTLEALRDTLAATIADAEPSNVAALFVEAVTGHDDRARRTHRFGGGGRSR